MKGSLFKILTIKSDIFLVAKTLFEADNDAPVFYSSEMLEIWQKITGFEVILPTLYYNEVAIIGLPMHKRSILHNVSFDGWDNLNVLRSKLCTAALEKEFWSQLLSTFKRVNLTCFSQNHQNFRSLPSIVSFAVPRRKCPYIDLNGGWEKLHQDVGKKLVRNIRQYGNKSREAGITFTVFPSKRIALQERINGLETAAGFHKVRMHTLKLESKFTPEAFEAYHKTVLDNAENCVIIEAKNSQGEYIAWYYRLINKSRIAWFNGSYHPDYMQYSIGTILVANLIDYALENGLVLFDFLRGNEVYKQKWTNRINQNETVYLAIATPRFIIDLYYRLFNETRHRMGSLRVIKLIVSQVFRKRAV